MANESSIIIAIILRLCQQVCYASAVLQFLSAPLKATACHPARLIVVGTDIMCSVAYRHTFSNACQC